MRDLNSLIPSEYCSRECELLVVRLTEMFRVGTSRKVCHYLPGRVAGDILSR